MAKRKTHNEDCFRILGQEFDHVNAWLDAYTEKYPVWRYLEYHRRFRHNKNGVKIIKKKWGLLAAEAAKIHIIRDVELYVLTAEFNKAVQYENIDKLYQKALKYVWSGK